MNCVTICVHNYVT